MPPRSPAIPKSTDEHAKSTLEGAPDILRLAKSILIRVPGILRHPPGRKDTPAAAPGQPARGACAPLLPHLRDSLRVLRALRVSFQPPPPIPLNP